MGDGALEVAGVPGPLCPHTYPRSIGIACVTRRVSLTGVLPFRCRASVRARSSTRRRRVEGSRHGDDAKALEHRRPRDRAGHEP